MTLEEQIAVAAGAIEIAAKVASETTDYRLSSQALSFAAIQAQALVRMASRLVDQSHASVSRLSDELLCETLEATANGLLFTAGRVGTYASLPLPDDLARELRRQCVGIMDTASDILEKVREIVERHTA